MNAAQIKTMATSVAFAADNEGGVSAFAVKLGVTRQSVHAWIRGDKIMAAENAVKAAEISGLSASKFRPDLFGED